MAGKWRAAFVAAAVLAGAAALAPAAARAAGEFVYPQTGPLTSVYDSPRAYGIHGALDIAGPNVSAVTAGRDGTVTFRGPNGGYGNLIILTHESGYTTYYAHLSSFAVSHGARVARGQTIGYEGSTGNSTGPHVHFEVRRYGSKQFLPGRSGNRVARGNAVPHTYAGLAGGGSSGGGATAGGGGGGGGTQTRGHGLTAHRVTASVLNVRNGPGTGHAILGQTTAGQVYASNGANGAWEHIWFKGGRGYSHGAYLARASHVRGRRVNVDALNVRTGPGTGNPSVGLIRRGDVYIENGRSGSWVRVWFDGGSRWIHGGYADELGL